MKKYLDTFILFGSLALLIMWVDQFLYKDVAMKDSYFFIMFALAGFLLYTYRRGQKKIKENNKPAEKNLEDRLKSKFTATTKKKSKKKQ